MSRCLPYQPKYPKEQSCVTESIKIKLQKEPESSKERRKERKKEKKEKREKSKDKSQSSKHGEDVHKKRKYNEIDEPIKLHTKDCYQQAAELKVVSEQLEKSGLTEEHVLPSLTAEPCNSSESTHSSLIKSRKIESTTISQGSHGGTIIRLKLPLHRQKDPKPTVMDEPCSSGRITSRDPEATSAKSTLAKDEPSTSVRVSEAAIEQKSSDKSKSRSSKRSRDPEAEFRSLISDWRPMPLPVDGYVGDEDLDWLLGNSRQKHKNSDVVSYNADKDLGNGNAMCSFQTRARYLPELDMYQLPYVVPF